MTLMWFQCCISELFNEFHVCYKIRVDALVEKGNSSLNVENKIMLQDFCGVDNIVNYWEGCNMLNSVWGIFLTFFL